MSQSPQPLNLTDEDAAVLLANDSGEILDMAMAELKRRLKEGNAEGIPGTGLMQLVNQGLKMKEKEMERDALNQEAVSVDPVEIIMNAPLPNERRFAQLKNLMDFHTDQIERIERIMDEQSFLRGQSEPQRSF